MIAEDGTVVRLNDAGENTRQRICPSCGLHAKLYKIRDKEICEGCGRDEIKKWNALVNT